MGRSKYNYCKVCGKLQTNFLYEEIIGKLFNYNSKQCAYCFSPVFPISEDIYNKYKEKWEIGDVALCKEFIQKYVVQDNPDFDETKANARLDKIIKWEESKKQRQAQHQKEQAEASKKHLSEVLAKEAAKHPQCPYCHSNDTYKISVVGRVADTAIWGIASDTIGKQFHCNNCNANF